jgi:hypothetical protein
LGDRTRLLHSYSKILNVSLWTRLYPTITHPQAKKRYPDRITFHFSAPCTSVDLAKRVAGFGSHCEGTAERGAAWVQRSCSLLLAGKHGSSLPASRLVPA